MEKTVRTVLAEELNLENTYYNLFNTARNTVDILEDGTNEEATKIYLVLPFILYLGYNILNPADVVPEHKPKYYTGNDRVDFALCDDYTPKIYIEVKKMSSELGNKEINWLAKYFNSDPYIKIGVLTNGKRYMFFTDNQHENLMDKEPFYVFDIQRNTIVDEYLLGYFSKVGFNDQCVENCNKTMQNINKITKGFMDTYKIKYDKTAQEYLNDKHEYNRKYIENLYEEYEIDIDYLPYDIAKVVIPLHKL